MPKKTGYVGKAGHLAVMGEFALRGYNVAMPEIDYGDDVFVTEDDTAKLWRIQVKTATPTRSVAEQPRSERFQLAIKKTFLANLDDNPPLYVIFVMRSKVPVERWRYLIIPRTRLLEYSNDGVGQDSGEMRKFDVSIHHTGANCGKAISSTIDLSRWMEKWDIWPVKDHA